MDTRTCVTIISKRTSLLLISNGLKISQEIASLTYYFSKSLFRLFILTMLFLVPFFTKFQYILFLSVVNVNVIAATNTTIVKTTGS